MRSGKVSSTSEWPSHAPGLQAGGHLVAQDLVVDPGDELGQVCPFLLADVLRDGVEVQQLQILLDDEGMDAALAVLAIVGRHVPTRPFLGGRHVGGEPGRADRDLEVAGAIRPVMERRARLEDDARQGGQLRGRLVGGRTHRLGSP